MKPQLSIDRIHGIIRDWCGTAVDVQPLAEGLTSQVYAFRDGIDEFVIRINNSIGSFHKDEYVQRRFGNKPLPIPEILVVQSINDTLAYCISRRAKGVRVQDLSTDGLNRITEPIVGVLKAISTTDITATSGYGPFNAEGTGAYERWRDFLDSVGHQPLYDWTALEDSQQKLVQGMAEEVKSLAGSMPEHRNLIHGDFGSFNVMADGDRVTAVIDWDLAAFGDPLYDWANLLFWHEDKLVPVTQRMDDVLRGEPNRNERLRCYQLRIGLEEIYRSVRGSVSMDSEWLFKRCSLLLLN